MTARGLFSIAQRQEAGTVRLGAVEPLGVSPLSSATTWQPYASPGHRPGSRSQQPRGSPNGAALFVVDHRRSGGSNLRIQSRPVGALNSDGFRHPGRWPGLTWGRPFGTQPQDLGCSFLDLVGATSQAHQTREWGSAVQRPKVIPVAGHQDVTIGDAVRSSDR